MDVGVALMFANFSDWERAQKRPDDPIVADTQFYRDELATGDLVEPLGFDSLWTAEHHFAPYCMEPNPLQLLTYFASRTERIDLGTCVVVVPWYQPLRVAEQMLLLDNFLTGDRKLIIGLGRGAAESEYQGLGIDMAQSRLRFSEGVDIVKLALTQDRFSYSGSIYQVPDITLRPRPRDPELASRMLCSWMSPESLEIAARLGLGMFFTTVKDPLLYAPEITRFNAIRAEMNLEPARASVFQCAYCAETEEEAWAGASQYFANWNAMGAVHYSLSDPAHFDKVGGYDWWAQRAREASSLDRGTITNAFAATQLWGTPAQIIEKIQRIRDGIDPERLVLFFKLPGMSFKQTKASMELFSREVLPAVRAVSAASAPA